MIGVVAGVIAAFVHALVEKQRRAKRLQGQFGRLAGRYRSTRKMWDEEEPGVITVTVTENVLRVRFEGLSPGREVMGQIAMNEQLVTSGAGHYEDVTDARQLWGFWDVQVKDDSTILVHTTYAHYRENRAVVSGFVWEPITPASERAEVGSALPKSPDNVPDPAESRTST